MNTATGCLPLVIATHRPWHQRVGLQMQDGLRAAWRRWQRQSAHAHCVAALRQLPAHTLHDIGLAECVRQQPTLPRLDWEFGRWQ